jgi:hypothetical protein
MSTIRAAQRRARRKHIKISNDELPSMVDAHFYGSEREDRLGWVEMYANEKGREKINALFPKGYIDWKPMPEGNSWTSKYPDWRAFEIHIPTMISLGGHNLPMDITNGVSPETPEAYAYLLCIGVRRSGARASLSNSWYGRVDIFHPNNEN